MIACWRRVRARWRATGWWTAGWWISGTLGWLFCGGLARALPTQEASPSPGPEALQLEMQVAKHEYVVGEILRLRLRVRMSRSFPREQMLQLFRQSLDVPVQIEADWLGGLEGLVPLEEDAFAAESAKGPSLVVQQEMDRGRWVDGESFSPAEQKAERKAGRPARTQQASRVLELWRAFRVEQPGPLTLAGPSLRYAFATRFEQTFLGERRALDRQEVSVRADDLRLSVRELPEEGRLPGFRGAVGQFSLRATANAEGVLEIGSVFQWTLHLTGEGNFGAFEPPRVEFAGLHVLGRITERDAEGLRWVFDLAVQAAVSEVPSQSFQYFCPSPSQGQPAGYRSLGSAAIPLQIRDPVSAPPAVLVDGADAGEGSAPHPERVRGLPWWLIVATAPLFVSLGWWLRRPRRSPPAPPLESSPPALPALLEGLQHPQAEVADLLLSYLSTRLRSRAPALVGSALVGRLRERGVDAELAGRVATLQEELLGARYGGPPCAVKRDEVAALIRKVDAQSE